MNTRCLLVVGMFTVACSSCLAQGTIKFTNIGDGLDAPIFDVDGLPIAALPDYRVTLFAGSDASSLAPVATTFLTSPGYFGEGLAEVVLPNRPPGYFGYFRVILWTTGGPRYEAGSFDAAAALGLWPIAASTPFSLQVSLGDPDAQPPIPAPPLYGLQSFAVTPIPEPAATWLLALGLAGLLGVTATKRCQA